MVREITPHGSSQVREKGRYRQKPDRAKAVIFPAMRPALNTPGVKQMAERWNPDRSVTQGCREGREGRGGSNERWVKLQGEPKEEAGKKTE